MKILTYKEEVGRGLDSVTHFGEYKMRACLWCGKDFMTWPCVRTCLDCKTHFAKTGTPGIRCVRVGR